MSLPARLLAVLGALSLLAAIAYFALDRSSTPPIAQAPSLPTPAAAPVPSLPELANEPAAPAPSAASVAPDPAPAVADDDLSRLEAAVATYEPAALPRIAPYLTHSDASLREAAREGLLQMGLTEAVPFLREAAGKVKDPREAIALLDAADFLALPSLTSTGGAKVTVRRLPAEKNPARAQSSRDGAPVAGPK